MDAALAGSFDHIGPAQLRDATRWYPDAGGKRLRPVMAMLACEAAGGQGEQALPIALAVELVHNFSLVHDDIMDRDATRRGRATVHVKWDEPTAILAGDVLFARAFEELSRIPDAEAHREAAALLSRAVLKLCEGQALDMAFEHVPMVSVGDYLTMIRGKTALLFEAATRGGALSSPKHSAAAVQALSTYGESFGMAFQIADDLLDATGDAKTLGKPWGSDIRAGKRTLLILEGQANSTAAQRGVIDRVLGKADATDADVASVVQVLRECGALARAEAVRDEHARAADKALDALPASPARDALRALNEWAVTRRS
ncbi:MAG: polyprenyl synthetase family protein [Candidatus Thermoplasmatota archaeon]